MFLFPRILLAPFVFFLVDLIDEVRLQTQKECMSHSLACILFWDWDLCFLCLLDTYCSWFNNHLTLNILKLSRYAHTVPISGPNFASLLLYLMEPLLFVLLIIFINSFAFCKFALSAYWAQTEERAWGYSSVQGRLSLSSWSCRHSTNVVSSIFSYFI